MSRRIRRKPCPACGKICYRDVEAAEYGARLLIRELVLHGYRVDQMYAYECSRSRMGYYHLTRMEHPVKPHPKSTPSIPLRAAAPPGYVAPVFRLTAEQFERLVDAQGRA